MLGSKYEITSMRKEFVSQPTVLECGGAPLVLFLSFSSVQVGLKVCVVGAKNEGKNFSHQKVSVKTARVEVAVWRKMW